MKLFILRFVFLLYLPEEGQICETPNQIQKKKKEKHGHLSHRYLECKYSVGFYVYISCVYINKGVLKLQQLLEVLFKYRAWGKLICLTGLCQFLSFP